MAGHLKLRLSFYDVFSPTVLARKNTTTTALTTTWATAPAFFALKITKNKQKKKKIISKSPEDCPPEALEQIPRRIEAYDISNIQSANAVGSMAVFTNGRPDKSQYRKFK